MYKPGPKEKNHKPKAFIYLQLPGQIIISILKLTSKTAKCKLPAVFNKKERNYKRKSIF